LFAICSIFPFPTRPGAVKLDRLSNNVKPMNVSLSVRPNGKAISCEKPYCVTPAESPSRSLKQL